MNEALCGFLATGAPAGLIGYVIGRTRPLHSLLRGTSMHRRITKYWHRFSDWLSDPKRLTPTVVLVGAVVVLSIVYTTVVDNRSDGRYDNLVRCIATHQADQSRAQLARTDASADLTAAQAAVNEAAENAVAADADMSDLVAFRAALADYRTAYDVYETTRQGAPYVAFSLDYCQEMR